MNWDISAKKSEQFMAWSLLLSTLYMHFSVEHNHGHHRYVATPKGFQLPRKRGQTLYGFWLQSIVGSYVSAWKIQLGLLQKNNQSFFQHCKSDVASFNCFQIAIGRNLFSNLGWQTWPDGLFLGSAFVGIVLLETINYIEHYGLSRREIKPGIYEKVQPSHSWNSDYALGRIMLV
jgi:alkane 1-monooxygenase